MKKYYTPSIDEFHVGFEYEVLINGNKWMWGDNNFPHSYAPNEATNYRVKYLNKEDIESLGFKHIGGKLIKDRKDLYEKDNLIIEYDFKNKIIKLYTKDPSKNNLMLKNVYDNKLIGGLKIKNKSELKKLLKQLYIE